MRRLASRSIAGSCVLLSLGAAAPQARGVDAKILDVYGNSLTAYKATAKTPNQDVRPRFDQRGTDIDGTVRGYAPLGWAIGGDPYGGGYASGRTLGDVNLCTGSYNPTDIDLTLPTLGLPVVIGRTYNCVQESSSPARFDSGGYQGFNWHQIIQPEIVIYEDGGNHANDALYIVYGADRYIEFNRIGSSADEWKAKNGAAGVVLRTATAGGEPETYTYYDQRGNKIVFFGDDNAGSAAWQMWKMIDTAGNAAYVGHATTGSTAISTGFVSSSPRISTITDASGMKYDFTYDTYGGYTRLKKVEAGSVAKVEYDYYTSTDDTNDKGLAGDLRLVKITLPTNDGDYVRYKYYRYYTRAWSNSDGRRGEAHQIKLVLGFEGARKYDSTDSNTFDQDYYSETDTNLKPYAEAFFEYGNGDYRVASATFNGSCGCGGGSSGTYTLTYANNTTSSPTYATAIANTSYDDVWGKRTVVYQPDTNYLSQYFDETGAVGARVLTNGDPSGSPTKKWVTDVDRNSSGQVIAIHSPANITGYTHSTGTITPASGDGLITKYTRSSASDDLVGLRTAVTVQKGTGGSPTTTSSMTMSIRQLVVGSSGVSAPILVTTVDAISNTTTYAHTFHSSTDTNVLYLVPKIIGVEHPAVADANHGPDTETYTYKYLRTDGSTAFTKDAGGIIFYTRRTAYGQVHSQVADCDQTSGDIDGSDAASNWSLTETGTPINVKTSYTYDNQGRLATTVRPAVGGTTRTSAQQYKTLADGRLVTLSSPRYASSNYHGPVSIAYTNHAGRTQRTAVIQVTSPSGSMPGHTTPDSTWSQMVDTIHDNTGMRVDATHTYTATNAHNDTFFFYDAMGRRDRTVDATGTLTRIKFDERGLVSQRWMGLNDNGWSTSLGESAGSVGGSSDIVKLEANTYDGGPSGDNGLLTTRVQDADGNWGGAGDQRTTSFEYDYRGRLIVQGNPVAPHIVNKYDNAGRVIATAQYNSTSGLSISTDPTTSTAATRVALSETFYDQRGQVWQSKRWEINTSSGDKDSSIATDYWYDGNGKLVKTWGSQIVKAYHDRLGRPIARFVLAGCEDEDYADALIVGAEDTVLEQSCTGLDYLTGRPLVQFTIQRHPLDGLATGDPAGTGGELYDDTHSAFDYIDADELHGRVQIAAMWYDNQDRLSDTVNFGTHEGTTFQYATYASSIPSRDDEHLRQTTEYDGWGRVSLTTDQASIVTKIEYDFAGRRNKVTENYTNSTPSVDNDRSTDYAYTNGLLTTVTRHVSASSGDDQITTYAYGTTTGTSQVATGHLLNQVTYPEQVALQSSTNRRTAYTYNALGQVLTTIDPNQDEIERTYDNGGRLILQNDPNASSSFAKIVTTYTSRGMVGTVEQQTDSSVTIDTVTFDYDGWGNVNSFQQGFASARDPVTMTFDYTVTSEADGPRRVIVDKWTQPDGGSGFDVTMRYTSDIDQRVGRPTGLDDPNVTPMVDYGYGGSCRTLRIGHPEPDIYMRSYFPDEDLEVTVIDYEGYVDIFNRPVSNRWVKDLGGSPLDPVFVAFSMTYNQAGQVDSMQDDVLMGAAVPGVRAFDQEDTYDALRRLAQREEGSLSGKAIATQARKENLTRNLAGRTTSDQISLNSDSDYTDGPPNSQNSGEMNDTRTYNHRNELRSRSVLDNDYPSSPRTVTLDYDNNGNLTDDGEKFTYSYDTWGRLIEIKDRAYPYATKAVYSYNGLGMRIGEQTDTSSNSAGTADGVVDAYDPVFYIASDLSGRRVATFRGDDDYPKETLVWHPAGMGGPGFAGGLILRDRNSVLTDPTYWAGQAAGDTRAERTYACSDFRGNVVALVSAAGALVEQYRYSANGVPIGIPLGDLDVNGTVDYAGTDADGDIAAALKAGDYEVRGDLNLDGDAGGDDEAIVMANDGVSTGRGLFSAPSVRNRVGFGNREFGLATVGLAVAPLENAWTAEFQDVGIAANDQSPSAQQGPPTAIPPTPNCHQQARAWIATTTISPHCAGPAIDAFVACCLGAGGNGTGCAAAGTAAGACGVTPPWIPPPTRGLTCKTACDADRIAGEATCNGLYSGCIVGCNPFWFGYSACVTGCQGVLNTCMAPVGRHWIACNERCDNLFPPPPTIPITTFPNPVPVPKLPPIVTCPPISIVPGTPPPGVPLPFPIVPIIIVPPTPVPPPPALWPPGWPWPPITTPPFKIPDPRDPSTWL